MSYLSIGMINCRKDNATICTASGKKSPLEGYGDLPLAFRLRSGEVPLMLRDVAHVPSLSYRLFFLGEL